MSTPVTHPFLQVEHLARAYPSPVGGEDVTVFDPADLLEPEPVITHTPPVGKPHIHLVNA